MTAPPRERQKNGMKGFFGGSRRELVVYFLPDLRSPWTDRAVALDRQGGRIDQMTIKNYQA
jgi:hypothetical protein